MEKLKSEGPARAQVAATLGGCGDARAVQPLINALSDSDADVRISAAFALGKLRDKRALQPLKGAARLQIALSPIKLGEKDKSMEVLREFVVSSDRGQKLSVLDGLEGINTPEAIAIIKEGSRDADPYVRAKAAMLLARLGESGAALPVLEEMLANPDKYVRLEALTGLGYIGNERAVQLISERLSSSDSEDRERAGVILRRARAQLGGRQSD
jgi:HEAT repeat protein